MSTLGILGSIAQGYTEAAKQRRDQNIALGEHQRDLQIGLLDKLLSDPSTPDEYKGELLKQRIATTNANQYDKNGMLKLPSLDDMRQALPPVQRPAMPLPQGAQTAPGITLPSAPPQGMAAAGPTGPAGASVAPPAALPTSGIQKSPGEASVPIHAPTPLAPPPMSAPLPPTGAGTAGMALPPTPIQLPAPPPIAEAGEFHALTQQEQMQRATALAVNHAHQLIQAGVPPAQAFVASGLMPKPELHNIPFLGTAINPYTGEQYGATSGTERPRGTPQVFQTDQGLVTLQQVQTGDGKYHWEDLQGNPTVPEPGWTKLVPATLPKERSSSTSDEFGTKTTTTSTTKAVVPGAPKTATMGSTKVSRPAAPPSASGTSGTGSPTPDNRTPAEKRADFQNEQYAVKQGMAMARKEAADTRTMVNLLDAQNDYMGEIAKGAQPTPRQDLSLIVAAVRAMNPGTVRLPQKELELELKAGSYGDRFQRQWETAVNGTLPADQRQDLFKIVQRETTNAAKDAAQDWTQYMGKAPVPAHLKRFSSQHSGTDTTTNHEDEAAKYLESIGHK